MLIDPGAFAPCMLAASVSDIMQIGEPSVARERWVQPNLSDITTP